MLYIEVLYSIQLLGSNPSLNFFNNKFIYGIDKVRFVTTWMSKARVGEYKLNIINRW